MSPASTALTTKVGSGSPYQLSSEQTLKASKALLAHIKSSSNTTPAGKKSLIKDADSEEDDSSDSPTIWLNLTTKKHITDTKRLKPSKIHLPYPLNASPTKTICLIVADPQRAYKDIVSSPAFPAALSTRITKVVGIDKLKKKFSQYEAQRKLFAEHEIFLADDRIVTFLPKTLGKTFYKSTAKRPIPISIQAPAPKTEGKKIARAKGNDKSGAGEPKAIAAEIEKALTTALVHLSPSTSTAVRVGYANMKAEELAANIEAVTKEMIEKFVPKKWRGVKSIYVKGAETAALPIWLAEELWVDEGDVLGEEVVEKLRIQQANVGKKRKGVEVEGEVKEKEGKKQKLLESNDNKLDKEIAERKERLKKQKAEVAGDAEDDVPKPSKKSKKQGKVVEV